MTSASAPIVVGVDFSDPSHVAWHAAMQLAKDMDTSLVLVHAFPQLHAPSLVSGDLAKQVIDEARAEISLEEAMTLHEKWVTVARNQGLDVHPIASDGRPADLVLQAVKDHGAGMIVVGSHGRSGLRRVVMGSVAEEILRGSKVPVLVVPAVKNAKGGKK